MTENQNVFQCESYIFHILTTHITEDFQWNWHNSGNKDLGIFKRKRKKINRQKSFLNSKTSFWRWDLIRRKVKHHNTTLKNKIRESTNIQGKDKHVFTQKMKTHSNPINLEPSARYPCVWCLDEDTKDKSVISSPVTLVWSKENITCVYEFDFFLLLCYLLFLKIYDKWTALNHPK